GSSDQLITGSINNLNTSTVRLRIIVDPVTQTVEGFYSTDGENYLNVGETYSTPTLSISDMGVTTSIAYTGIFATHRNSSTAVTYSFDDFTVEDLDVELVTPCIPISTLPCEQIQVDLPYNL